MDDKNVSLTISKEIVTPIVEAKIKEAILQALGGRDELIEKVIEEIVYRKVTKEGKISNYDRDNKYTWLDVVVTNQIRDAIEAELRTQIIELSQPIKEALVKKLRSIRGSNMVAESLLSALDKTLEKSWTSTIEVKINSRGE